MLRYFKIPFLLFLPLLFLILGLSSSAAYASSSSSAPQGILAIDLGTEALKFSLVQHGVPFDILYNRESKRKTDSLVAWRADDSFVAAEASPIATRFPKDSLASIKALLGGDSSQYSRVYPNVLVPRSPSSSSASPTSDIPPRGLRLQRTDGSYVYIEEALSQIFSYAKTLAQEASSGGIVQDTIVTVPAFFDTFERQAVLSALKLANLKPLLMMNDGSAAAVNYAMSRSFNETPTYHLFYDAGAGSVKSTIVSFIQSDSASAPLLDIRGVGWDKTAGGLEMSSRLRNILQRRFDEEHSSSGIPSVKSNERAMAKLLKEAGRVKQVLSVNSDATARIESLHEDIDMFLLVSRSDFESTCVDLQPRFTQPILDSFSAANLTMDDISSVVLLGGSSRVPLVRDAIRKVVPDDKIAQNLNADEAAVMGAALYGASLKPQFRTKNVKLLDYHTWSTGISLKLESSSKGDQSKQDVLFTRESQLGSTKILLIPQQIGNEKDNDSYNLVFSDDDESSPLFNVQVSGIADAIKKLNKTTTTSASSSASSSSSSDSASATPTESVDDEKKEFAVKVWIELGQSDLVMVKKARLVNMPKDASNNDNSVTDRLKGLFGAGNQKKEGSSSHHFGTPESSIIVIDKALQQDDDNSTDKKFDSGGIALKLKTTYYDKARPLSQNEHSEAKKRLEAQANSRKQKVEKSETLNKIESYVYKLRDLLKSGDNDENVDRDSENCTRSASCMFKKFAKPEEIQALQKGVESTMEWLSYEAQSAGISVFKEKLSKLENLEKPVQVRITDHQDRPFVIQQVIAHLSTAKSVMGSAQDTLLVERVNEDEHDEEDKAEGERERKELERLVGAVDEHTVWVDKMLVEKGQEDGTDITPTSRIRSQVNLIKSDTEKILAWRKRWNARTTRLVRKASVRAKLRASSSSLSSLTEETPSATSAEEANDNPDVAATSPRATNDSSDNKDSAGAGSTQQSSSSPQQEPSSSSSLKDNHPTEGYYAHEYSSTSSSDHPHNHDEL